MANTTIAIKKSSTPSAEPTNLANGELAINFADGKLFYKNVSGQIVSFTSGSNSFGTVNANGTLIVADTTGDILTLEAGNNITITADAINDKITISSTGGGGSNVTVATSQIKDLTSNDYVVTNVATIATVVDSSVAIAAFDKANTFNNVYTTIAGANTAVGTGANAFTSATVSGANTIAIAAFDKANAALSNSTTTYVGTLTVVGNTTSNTTITNSDVQVGGISVNMPPGTIIQFGGNTAPTGMLSCDGSAVSRNTYSRLFSSINTLWGAGNGNTTFNLPDFRGNFPRGWDNGANVDTGRAFASLQTQSVQKHKHNGVWYYYGNGGWDGVGPEGIACNSPGNNPPTAYDSRDSGGTQLTDETRPRNIAVLFCIKY